MIEHNLLSLSYGRIIRKQINGVGGLRPASYETYNIIDAGDVVLRMTDLQNDKRSIRTSQATERGLITSAYITVRPDARKTDPRFVAAVLRAYDIQKAYYEMGAGVRQNLGYSELADLPIPLPDRATQQRLADYLDRETGEIDAMIAKMDALTGQLNTRRRETIDKAFGVVDATAPLWAYTEIRPSNVDKKTKDGERSVRLVNYTDVYYNQTITTDHEFMEATASEEHIERFRVAPGDIIITKDSESPDDIGVPALVTASAPDMVCAYHLTLLRPDATIADSRFLYWVLESGLARQHWLKNSFGVTRFSILTGAISRLRVPRLSLNEQRRIADHLDEVTSRIDQMLAKVAELKTLLTERRAALITEVVTGRKEVA